MPYDVMKKMIKQKQTSQLLYEDVVVRNQVKELSDSSQNLVNISILLIYAFSQLEYFLVSIYIMFMFLLSYNLL